MAESVRQMGITTVITPMCHWLYFEKNAWYWKNLITQTRNNVRRIELLIEQHAIDVVYTNTSAIFEPAKAARRKNMPHLWHVHEVLKPGNRMSQLLPLKWMQKFIKKHSNQLVFESNSARATFNKTVTIPDSQVVYNSLRLQADDLPSNEQVQQCRDRLGISLGKPVVAYVGQFIDRKNPLLLLEAIEQLNVETRPFCIFVGEGPLQKEMQEKIETKNLQYCCKIIPFQQDIRDVMIACDILALPSRQESFGLVLLEAAAYQKPVVACQSQGPCEIVLQGETGYLTPQGQPEAMADAIRKLAADDALRDRLGKAGRQRTRDLFSPEINTAKLSEFIIQLHEKSSFSRAIVS